MLRVLLYFLVFVGLCSSCDEERRWQAPPASFSSFPRGKTENLQLLLGSYLVLTAARDTQHVKVSFDPHTQLNLLTTAATGDTLLLARVIRHRRLFYLIQRASDSTYAVHVARIRAHFVQGLNTNWQQMVYLDDATKRGQFSALIQSQNSEQGTQLLRFDLQALRPFFNAVLDSLPRYAITQASVTASRPQPSSHRSLAQSATSREQLSMYPNPATDHVTLAFATPGRWTVQLYALDGHVVHTQQVQTTSARLSLTQLPAGGYLVKVTEESTGDGTSKRLLVRWSSLGAQKQDVYFLRHERKNQQVHAG